MLYAAYIPLTSYKIRGHEPRIALLEDNRHSVQLYLYDDSGRQLNQHWFVNMLAAQLYVDIQTHATLDMWFPVELDLALKKSERAYKKQLQILSDLLHSLMLDNVFESSMLMTKLLGGDRVVNEKAIHNLWEYTIDVHFSRERRKQVAMDEMYRILIAESDPASAQSLAIRHYRGLVRAVTGEARSAFHAVYISYKNRNLSVLESGTSN